MWPQLINVCNTITAVKTR